MGESIRGDDKGDFECIKLGLNRTVPSYITDRLGTGMRSLFGWCLEAMVKVMTDAG